jgi:hypothetical protein
MVLCPLLIQTCKLQPATRLKHGRLLFVLSHHEGTLAEIDAELVREIKQMRSFVDMELFPKVKMCVVAEGIMDTGTATHRNASWLRFRSGARLRRLLIVSRLEVLSS